MSLIQFYPPDFAREFIIQIEGSPSGLKAVLLQDYANARFVIARVSRNLTSEEQASSVLEREIAALCFAADTFTQIIGHRHFRVETDCRILQWHLSN